VAVVFAALGAVVGCVVAAEADVDFETHFLGGMGIERRLSFVLVVCGNGLWLGWYCR
jgi:hypothetical protein